MSLETEIMSRLKDAMKAKDEAALRSLRAIKAEIIIAKTEPGAGGEINEDVELKLLQKLVKQRKDSFDIFTNQGREDLAKIEMEEIAVIEKFLPKQLTEAELKEAITAIITKMGAVSAADFGKIMGIATKQFAGKADGKAIASTVKELLKK